MAQFPTMQLHTDAYLGDTMHLTLEQHGAYLKLLMIAWRSEGCCLPNDDARLSRMLGVTAKKWSAIKPVVMEFFALEDGVWVQHRLTKTFRAVAKKSEDNRIRASLGGQAKALKNKDSSLLKAPSKQCLNVPNHNHNHISTIVDNNPPTPLKGKPRAKKPPLEIPDWVHPEAWGEFKKMREAIGDKLTDGKALKVLYSLNRLREQGQDVKAVLDQSTQKGWKGVFEIKENYNGYQSNRNDGAGQRIANPLLRNAIEFAAKNGNEF